MKKFFKLLAKALTAAATVLSYVSLRGLVFVLGVVLALSAPRQHPLTPIDDALVKASSYLFPSPLGASNIAIVRVPREEVSLWQTDIHSSGTLAALLSNMLNSSNAVVGVLLQQPIDTGAGAVDSVIENYVRENSDTASQKAAKGLVDRKFILMDLLTSERVVLGVERFFFSGQSPLLVQAPFAEQMPEPLQQILWPECTTCFTIESAVRVARPKISQHTILDAYPPHFQVTFSDHEGKTFTGFFIEYLRAVQGLDTSSHLIWDQSGALALGRYRIPLSVLGQFIPLNSLTQRMAPSFEEIPLDEALARNAFPDVVLIAAEGDATAAELARAFYSVRHEGVLHSPWWTSLVSVLLVLLITLYLVFVSTKISLRVASLISLIFCVAIVLTQLGLLLARGLWLPLALPLAWLFAGHFLLMIWVIKKRRIRQIVERADAICIARAHSLIEQKSLDEAMQQLTGCTVKEPLLQTMYEISEAFTAQQNYQRAIEVLAMIQKKSKSFKDTEQKLQVLTTMHKTMHEDSHKEPTLDKTMVIAKSSRAPTSLGRYRLEKEIGRGAMGQVYLGFDPRIARRVAIKTLSYDHFSGKEIATIKARFFREAEAAGRLNHPSIVSVFDVGEQSDKAYIAMDYAEGKALNHFVNPNNLLPVFEVYRIIYDVAVALEYAHENNIVHRDIKPGNIIYNPAPYQVKVTDFGIARLVDDSRTSTGEILGSPLYMAPEQLKGKKVNRAADIFSLGVTFYQLLTGRLPYAGENLAALTYEIIHGRHKGVRSVRSELPVSASRITNQALQKDPEDRYETAAEMATVLKKAIRRDFASQAKKVGLI